MIKGYRDGSKMSRTLDYLARKGIDCIKVAGPRHIIEGTIFFPLNTLEDGNFIKSIYRAEGEITTDEDMIIEVDKMYGEDISELNSKLNLEKDKIYDVLKVRYL